MKAHEPTTMASFKGVLRASAVVTAVAAILIHRWSQPTPISFRSNSGSIRPLASTLTNREIANYKRDGFLLIRNFVQGNELDELVKSAEQIYSSWHPMDLIFKTFYAKLSMQVWRHSSSFARLAFESSLPSISAQLMEEKDSVRLLKDAVFGHTAAGAGCGFHVDDEAFWPADVASRGVQYWLALSPVRVAEGGGIRVTNQSLTADFADECLSVIRSDGFKTTCIMERLSPTCNQQMLDASVIYDMEPGDILIWDRYTFHRSEPFSVNNTKEHKLRYTVRYIPSNARAEGSKLHPSIEPGALFNNAYYPQVWPETLELEADDIMNGLGADFQIMTLLKQVVMRTLGLKM